MMTDLWLLAGLALLSAGQPAEPAATAQMLDFPAVETPGSRAAAQQAAERALVETLVLRRCTAAGDWCAELVPEGEGWQLEITGPAGTQAPAPRARFDPPDQEHGEPFFALWPHIVREPDGAVTIGLLATRRTGFSGGGALATRLILVRVAPDAAEPATVLTVPAEGSAMIRACFSEADMRRRREACHDEYELEGTLTLAPDDGSGRARFLFATRARTYPGEVTRWEDSGERPPLQRGDLVWADDATCSYRRTFTYDPTAGRYVADSPLPDCGQFLVGEMALPGPEGVD